MLLFVITESVMSKISVIDYSKHKLVYWVPYHRLFTNLVYVFIINNNATFTTKSPGEKIFLLAKFAIYLLSILV